MGSAASARSENANQSAIRQIPKSAPRVRQASQVSQPGAGFSGCAGRASATVRPVFPGGTSGRIGPIIDVTILGFPGPRCSRGLQSPADTFHQPCIIRLSGATRASHQPAILDERTERGLTANRDSRRMCKSRPTRRKRFRRPAYTESWVPSEPSGAYCGRSEWSKPRYPRRCRLVKPP